MSAPPPRPRCVSDRGTRGAGAMLRAGCEAVGATLTWETAAAAATGTPRPEAGRAPGIGRRSPCSESRGPGGSLEADPSPPALVPVSLSHSPPGSREHILPSKTRAQMGLFTDLESPWEGGCLFWLHAPCGSRWAGDSELLPAPSQSWGLSCSRKPQLLRPRSCPPTPVVSGHSMSPHGRPGPIRCVTTGHKSVTSLSS